MERALRHVTALTFERLAFAVPLDEPAELREPTVSRQVAFDGPFAGRVVVTVERAMLAALAANMLGVDGPPSAAEQGDALGEVANVLCGNLLPRIAGTTHVFQLAAPGPPAAGGVPAALATLALDLGTVAVGFYREDGR